MRKILLIVKREIAVKVSDKFFIAITFLAPILFVMVFKLYDDPRFFEDVEVGESLLTFISITSAIAVYFIVFFYSIRTMHSVLEEKSNRIVEIIISSVKPFQLMLGKIIGITAVVFMQMMAWVFLTVLLAYAISSLSPSTIQPLTAVQSQQDVTDYEEHSATEFAIKKGKLSQALAQLPAKDMLAILFFFGFYLTGGFILYSALFAAIGAMADSDTDTIQLMIPVMIPLVLALTVVPSVFKNPHNDVAFWTSLIPFTSPVVMMMRAPFEVPWWQMVLSMALLILGIIFTVYAAAKIYRVTILAHGKKITIKTLYRWFVLAR